jgi:hypothetical protein
MKVFVYYNLHKKVFSVKALEGDMKGRVVAHRLQVCLTDAQFKVSEAGRQRVLQEQRKNVHAGVVGQWDDRLAVNLGVEVTYNPYKYDSFVTKVGEFPVRRAGQVLLDNRKIFAQGIDF